MESFAGRLRTPEERVGGLPKASLPPPVLAGETMSEDDLLLRALVHRDERAFSDVMDRYYGVMVRLAMTHVDSRAVAEEVVQDTWLAAIRGIDRFERRSSVKTWLFRILRNLARTRGSRDSRMRPFSDIAARFGETTQDPHEMIVDAGSLSSAGTRQAMWVSSADPEQQLLSQELAGQIERAMALLPPRQREVIALRDVEGWSAEDVCNALGLSQTNQRVLLHRAREKVREELRHYMTNNNCGDDDERYVQ